MNKDKLMNKIAHKLVQMETASLHSLNQQLKHQLNEGHNVTAAKSTKKSANGDFRQYIVPEKMTHALLHLGYRPLGSKVLNPGAPLGKEVLAITYLHQRLPNTSVSISHHPKHGTEIHQFQSGVYENFKVGKGHKVKTPQDIFDYHLNMFRH